MKIYKVIRCFSLSVPQVKFYTLISVFMAMIDKKSHFLYVETLLEFSCISEMEIKLCTTYII